MNSGNPFKAAMDLGAVITAAGSFMEAIPAIAAGASIIWLALRIYEHARWIKRGRKEGERPW